MCEKFERLLAYHCSPTLAGIKPSSLIALPARQYADLPALLEQYGALLHSRGIFLEVLCRCRQRALLLVYRPEQLTACLDHPKARSLLQLCDYPVSLPLSNLLSHLKTRMEQEGFPHEIGLFLGYPPEDVMGFSLYQGENYKLCGHWKVYFDEENARKCFERYDRCRAAVCRKLAGGCSLSEIFPVA